VPCSEVLYVVANVSISSPRAASNDASQSGDDDEAWRHRAATAVARTRSFVAGSVV